MKRRLLAIAFHFPPIQDSSGVHRALAYARYLPEHDWAVTVLTAHARAYESSAAANLAMIPAETEVVRAPAWDAARHFAMLGRYPDLLALPDRWQSWIPGAILAGLSIVRRRRPAAIFSTYPIASAHVVGLALHRLTGLPWIADLRDPMQEGNYPPDPRVRSCFQWIEAQVFRHAERVTVTTPGTAALYRERYGEEAARRITVIGNGFDPEVFAESPPGETGAQARDPGRRLVLVHSGVIYPRERNPEPFLRALARLRQEAAGPTGPLRVLFRGSGQDERYAGLVRSLGLEDVVELLPSLPYREALAEMRGADALLVLQACHCNRQIPAKAYEYLYAGRPILALADPAGDTGQLLARMGVEGIAALESEQAIYAMLREALPRLRAGTLRVTPREDVMSLSRRARTADLAALLDGLGTGSNAPSRMAASP